MLVMRHWRPIALSLLVLLAAAPAAEARKSFKKGIWGPVRVDGVSQFPIYAQLGAGVYHTRLSWRETATRRPADPRNPGDPAYAWPAELDDAVAEARRHGMRVAVDAARSPAWANGGRPDNWAPTRPADYADFIAAAARRYPSVRYWIIWGEPVRRPNWMPMEHTHAWKPLTPAQAAPARRYARLLDAAYAAVKSVSRRALVVGGNSFTNGDIAPRNFIRNLKLPSGRPPRMDLYGHNPFAARRPDLSRPPIRDGQADFCDLDDLVRWIDRDLGRAPGGRRLKLWLGEYFAPTDHANREFGWWVSRRTAASWLSSGLRITRRWNRIETLNWLTLYDDAPRPEGDETNKGLIDRHGRRKPAFWAFARG
jgi:hypothetical protein